MLRYFSFHILLVALLSVLIACSTAEPSPHTHDTAELPPLAAVPLDGRPLNVVATTSIIGDVVAHIGGTAISLITLMQVGEDPHSYTATPSDLIALEEADIIFVNGWDLEEGLAETIEQNYGDRLVVISAGIDPRSLSSDDDNHSDDEHGHGDGSADPHVWMSIPHVKQWADTAEHVLHQLDPANEAVYTANVAAYQSELAALETEVAALIAEIPAEKRKLVTNHDAFGYLADDYQFEVVGTVIPAASTGAEPSANDLANLITAMKREAVCTIFSETTVSSSLAETVAAELDGCERVPVLPLLTGSLGTGDASTYIGMYRSNIETIAAGLQ